MTYKDIKHNEEVNELLKKGNQNLGLLGYTDHSQAHCVRVAETAALIIGDKTDVRRSRVREKPKASFDIHDRVNYAVTDQTLKVNPEKQVISLNLQIDTDICSMYEYFEIFLQRMLMCRGVADLLGATFKLTANGAKVL